MAKTKPWFERNKKHSKKYCPVCKHKIRGKNHIEGEHHQAVLRAQAKY